jgi:hypothetical protein
MRHLGVVLTPEGILGDFEPPGKGLDVPGFHAGIDHLDR